MTHKQRLYILLGAIIAFVVWLSYRVWPPDTQPQAPTGMSATESSTDHAGGATAGKSTANTRSSAAGPETPAMTAAPGRRQAGGTAGAGRKTSSQSVREAVIAHRNAIQRGDRSRPTDLPQFVPAKPDAAPAEDDSSAVSKR